MCIADRLRATAARVRQGWCQGRMFDGAGNTCVYGAIEEVTDSALSAHHVASFAEAVLGLTPSADLHPLAVWNDAEGQTAEGVATGLEFAALIWDEQEAQSVRSSDTHQLQEA